MDREEAEIFRDRDWQIAPDKDGRVSNEQVSHALLIDLRTELKGVRESLGGIRAMLVFFVVVTVVGLVVGVLFALSHL